MKKLTLLFLLFSQISMAQSNLAKEVIQKIEFETDTIQAVFSWVTDNIKYDVQKLLKRQKTPISKRFSSFSSIEEKRTIMFKEVVRKKKGVCEDYSVLFDVILQELGYESFIISGYTKNARGKVSSSMGHTWNAVKVNNHWKLYDPTWGAGMVNEKKRFVKKYNPKWFDTDPEVMLESHLPYDPIWQLRAEPMTYKDFEDGSSIVASEKIYNAGTIDDYLKMEPTSQYKAQLDRSLAMGVGAGAMMRWRKNLAQRIKNNNINKKVDTLNEAGQKFNAAKDLFNDFVKAQKNKFKGPNHSPEIIREKLTLANSNAKSALATFKSVSIEEPKRRRSLRDAISSTEKLLATIDRAMDYLNNKE